MTSRSERFLANLSPTRCVVVDEERQKSINAVFLTLPELAAFEACMDKLRKVLGEFCRQGSGAFGRSFSVEVRKCDLLTMTIGCHFNGLHLVEDVFCPLREKISERFQFCLDEVLTAWGMDHTTADYMGFYAATVEHRIERTGLGEWYAGFAQERNLRAFFDPSKLVGQGGIEASWYGESPRKEKHAVCLLETKSRVRPKRLFYMGSKNAYGIHECHPLVGITKDAGAWNLTCTGLLNKKELRHSIW